VLWTKDLLHVWHDIDRTITDNATDEWRPRACVRAKGGHFKQILWQYSTIWQETFQFLSNVTQFLDCFFFGNYHKFELSKIMRQHCGEICWKFSSLSCSERIVKLSVDKVISMSLVYYFLGHSVESLLKTAWSYVHLSWLNVSVWQTTRRLYALCIAVLMLARV